MYAHVSTCKNDKIIFLNIKNIEEKHKDKNKINEFRKHQKYSNSKSRSFEKAKKLKLLII
jgi:hypothetical protein